MAETGVRGNESMNQKIDQAVKMIKEAQHILVFTGAGISTASGIADFRGPDGLYQWAKEKYYLPYPEALFDLNYFAGDPRPFFDLSKKLFLLDSQPGKCHKLIARLEELGKVNTVVTQNIDMLHQKAGSVNVVACHGSYEKARCLGCRRAYELLEIEEDILEDRIPRCSCGGVIKPDVVFFGEALPEEFYTLMDNPPETDLVLILGTSLKVQPAAQFALDMARRHPAILVNLVETGYEKEMELFLPMNLEAFAEAASDALEHPYQMIQ